MARWLQQIRIYPLQFFKTMVIYTTILAMGLGSGLFGPTLLDLRTQVSRSLSEISLVMPARSLGFGVGSMAMGFTYQRVNILLFGSVAMTLATITTALIPHILDLWSLLVVFLFNGIFLGGFEAGSNMLLLHIWGKEIGPFMQAYHFFFGVGALIGPLIAQPFLVEVEDLTGDSNVTEFTKQISSVYNLTDNAPLLRSTEKTIGPNDLMLVYPYSIVAGSLFINGLAYLFLYIKYPHTEEHPTRKQQSQVEQPKSQETQLTTVSEDAEKQHQDKAEQEQKINLNKTIVVVLTVVFMHIYYGIELTFGSYLVTFAVESDLHLTKVVGTNMTALYWATFTFWRCVTIFYIEYLGNELNVLFALITVLIGNAILVPFGDSSVVCLWTGVAVFGLGTSSIWGCVFAYLEEHFPVTSKIAASMVVSACVGEFIFPFVISYFIVSTPTVFLWLTLTCSVAVFAIFLTMMFFMRKIRRLK